MGNFRQQYLEKRQTQIYTRIGTLVHLFSGKMEIKKIWQTNQFLYALTKIIWEKELDYKRTVFIKINDYLAKTVDNIIKNELQKENIDIATEPKAMKQNKNNEIKIQLFLPFMENKEFSYFSKLKSS